MCDTIHWKSIVSEEECFHWPLTDASRTSGPEVIPETVTQPDKIFSFFSPLLICLLVSWSVVTEFKRLNKGQIRLLSHQRISERSFVVSDNSALSG